MIEVYLINILTRNKFCRFYTIFGVSEINKMLGLAKEKCYFKNMFLNPEKLRNVRRQTVIDSRNLTDKV